MNYLIVILISLVANALCRSLTPNVEDANDEQTLVRVQRIANDDQSAAPKQVMDIQLNELIPYSRMYSVPSNTDLKDTEGFMEFENEQLQKLLSLFLKWIGQSTEHEQKVTQWLRQLMLVAKELSVKVNEVTSSVSSDKPVGRTVGSFLKDLLLAQDEQNQKQTTNEPEVDVQASSNIHLVHEMMTGGNSSSKFAENETEYVNEILAEAQSLMGRIQKFFDKLCREHHATRLEEKHKVEQSMAADVNQGKEVPIM